MEFLLPDQNNGRFSLVQIKYKGESVLIDATGYSTTRSNAVVMEKGKPTLHLFDEVNQYVNNYLTEEQRQDLFAAYVRLDKIFTDDLESRRKTERSTDALARTLSGVVTDIFNIVDLEDMRTMLVKDVRVHLPSDIRNVYESEDKIRTKHLDGTYLKDEYLDLVTLCMALRFLIPIWGKYIDLRSKETKEELGRQLKELFALNLIDGSKLARHRSIERLDRYIRSHMTADMGDLGTIYSGLSSEEIPTHLMGLTMVRKLSIAPLCHSVGSVHLMKVMYHYIINRSGQLHRNMGSTIRSKQNSSTNMDGEDNQSVWDKYKNRQEVGVGDLMIVETFVRDYFKMAKRLEPDISKEKLDKCIEYVKETIRFNPTESQLTLVAWIAAPIIPGNMVKLFDRDIIAILFGMSQAILWEWGYHELAIMLTAEVIPQANHVRRTRFNRTSLSKEITSKLEEICPFTLPEDKDSPVGQYPNPQIRSIELVSNGFFNSVWEYRCPPELAGLVENLITFQVITPPMDLRNQLGNMLIKLDTIL